MTTLDAVLLLLLPLLLMFFYDDVRAFDDDPEVIRRQLASLFEEPGSHQQMESRQQRAGDEISGQLFKFKFNNGTDDRLRALDVQSRGVCDCGIQQYVPHRIYGGNEAFPNEYPWMAALVFPPGTVSCGASLISPRFVLSAAHCFLTSPSSLYVVLGAHDLRFVGGGGVLAVPARQIVVHPKFDRASGDYDVALVEFATDVQFGPNVSPICLPFPNLDVTWHPVVVSGWGLTRFAPASFTLQEVTLTAVPNEVCQAQYTTINPLTERMLCAWGDGKDACRGDSGGPLTWNYQGRWYVVGVVSFGMECGTASAAGVYTRIESFLDWILSETDNTGCLSPAGTPSAATLQYPWLISRSTSSAFPSAGNSSSSAASTLTTSSRVTGALG